MYTLLFSLTFGNAALFYALKRENVTQGQCSSCILLHLTGNHTVGIVCGTEDYDVLKASCKNIFAEINDLVDAGGIEVDGNKIT